MAPPCSPTFIIFLITLQRPSANASGSRTWPIPIAPRKKRAQVVSTPTAGSAGVFEAKAGPEAMRARLGGGEHRPPRHLQHPNLWAPSACLSSSLTLIHTEKKKEMRVLNTNLVNYVIFKYLEIHCRVEQAQVGEEPKESPPGRSWHHRSPSFSGPGSLLGSLGRSCPSGRRFLK